MSFFKDKAFVDLDVVEQTLRNNLHIAPRTLAEVLSKLNERSTNFPVLLALNLEDV